MFIKHYIDEEEFQKLILSFICTERYKEILETMSYTDKEFEQGFIQGLTWAALLTTECAKNSSYHIAQEIIDTLKAYLKEAEVRL